MNEDLFDGFEVRTRATKNTQWEAYFPEFTQMNFVSDSINSSLCELYKKWDNYKKDCNIKKENVPIPASEKNFSGQINIRIDPIIHKSLVVESVKNGVSLNSFISKKLSDSINKNRKENFEIEGVERLRLDPFSLILYFSNQNGERVGLKFSTYNLADELRDYGGDKTVESDEELKKRFQKEEPLRTAVQCFISQQTFISQLKEEEPVQVLQCIIIYHDSIKDACRGKEISFPKNPLAFLICKID